MIDELDRKILDLLQEDCGTSLAELGERVHLSRNAVWRRIARLEEEGYIVGRSARLNRDRLNLGLTVFIEIRTDTHSLEWLDRFQAAIRDIPELVGVYRMSGDVDYLLHAVIPDMPSYDALYKRIISRIALADVSSRFVMEDIKETNRLPLNYAQ